MRDEKGFEGDKVGLQRQALVPDRLGLEWHSKEFTVYPVGAKESPSDSC